MAGDDASKWQILLSDAVESLTDELSTSLGEKFIAHLKYIEAEKFVRVLILDAVSSTCWKKGLQACVNNGDWSRLVANRTFCIRLYICCKS